MKTKEICDFGALYITKYTYDNPRKTFFEVYTADHELIDAFNTAQQAKKFCKDWILENIPHDC